MMRNPNETMESRKSVAPNKVPGRTPKGAVQAFSDMTNSLSECSPNDRPMSHGLPSEDTSSPRANKLVDTAEKSVSVSQRATEESEQSESEYTSKESEVTSKEELKSFDTESIGEDVDVDRPPKKRKQTGPVPVPTAIFFGEKDKLEIRDATTGAVTFWHNTAPMMRSVRIFHPRWTTIVPDPGTGAFWPTTEPNCDPNLSAAQQDEYVENMAAAAMMCQPVRIVNECDRPWPDLAFAHINDLDRALADTATRLVIQAIESGKAKRLQKIVTSEEQRVNGSKAFIEHIGQTGNKIGDDFRQAAQHFEEIASILELLRRVYSTPSTTAQRDAKYLKQELHTVGQTLKEHLASLKSAIVEYGGAIANNLLDTKAPTTAPLPLDSAVDQHHVAQRLAQQLKADIASECGKDETGVMRRWYEQSRLRLVLNNVDKCSNDQIRQAEEEERAEKNLDRMKKDFAELLKKTQVLKTGTFATNSYYAGQKSGRTPPADVEKGDLYAVPEPLTLNQVLNTKPGATCRTEKPKKSTAAAEKFDFYSAPEPPDGDDI